MKKALVLLLCLVLAAGGGGCAGNNGGENGTEPGGESGVEPEGQTAPGSLDESVYSLGNPVDAPIEVDYLVRNRLEVADVSIPVTPAEGDTCEYEHSIVEISGLKNAEVEALINQRIRAAYEELAAADLPPYRGIKKAIPEGAVKRSEQISAYCNANYNNILCITISKYSSYVIPDENGKLRRDDWSFIQDVSDAVRLNIDLNSGKDIPLCALFGDGVDYMTLINDALAATLAASSAEDEGWHDQWTGVWQTGPFTGLGPDVKFFISDWNGLILVADYDTPQFYTDSYYPAEIPLGLSTGLSEEYVLPYRYWSPDSDLFSGSGEGERFFPQFDSLSAPVFYEDRLEDGVSITASIKCPPELPEKLQALLRDATTPDPVVLAELKALAKIPSKDGEEYTYYYTEASGSRMGPYYNLRFYTGASSDFDRDYSFRTEKYTCYDAATLEPLPLSSLFTQGFDYETLFVDKMMAQLNEQYSAYTEKDFEVDESIRTAMSQPEALRELLTRRFRENQENFRIESDSLSYTFGGRVNDSSMDEFQWTLSSLYIWLPYSEIGYENLTIFD